MFAEDYFSSSKRTHSQNRQLVLILSLIFCFSTRALEASTKNWTNDTGDLQWGTDDNWDPAGIPGASESTQFTNLGLSPGNTIILGADRSAGSLIYNLTTSFTIGGPSGALTLTTGDITRSASSSSTQTISRPVALGDNAVWDISGSGLLTVSNTISGNYSLEKRGTGTLNMSGPNTYNGTTSVQNGTLTISGGSTASTGFAVATDSTLSFTSGTHSLGGATFTNAGTINFSGATLSFNAATSIPGTVNFSSGTLSGTDTTTFSGPLTWTNGTMTGAGSTSISSGGSLNVTVTNYSHTLARTLNNSSTIIMSGTGYFSSSGGGSAPVINNLTGATCNIQSDMSLASSDATPATFNNAGTLKKSAGTGTSNISTLWTCYNTNTVQVLSGTLKFSGSFNNTGTADVQAGLLNLAGGGTSSGTFNVSPGATLSFTGGTHTLGGATFSNSGTINFSGGTDNFSAATTIPGTVNIANATMNFNSVAASNLTGTASFSSGTLGGSGPVNFQNLTWTGGTMTGAGSTSILAGGTLNATVPIFTHYLARTLNNSGTATISGSGNLLSSGGGSAPVINNLSGATFDIQSNFGLASSDATTAAFNNTGTFKKSAGTGVSTIYSKWTFNNPGTLQVQSGTLRIQGPVTQLVGTTLTGGTWQVMANSTLDITTGSNILTNQGNVTLAGLNSTFSKIETLENNQGSFSILDGWDFEREEVGDFINSGTLKVGSDSDFSINGGLMGIGNTIISGTVTVDAIAQNMVIGNPGGKLIIRAHGSMARRLGGATQPVPEPGTIVLLLIAAAMALGMRKSARRIG